MVYTAAQCKKAPVAGSDLCETCRRHEAKGSSAKDWNGRITGPVPDDSHTTGSLWFTNTKPRWRGMVLLPLGYGSSSRAIFVVGDHLYYRIDEATEKPGEYQGQFVDGDEPDIDMDAPEVVVDVSSSPADLEAARITELEAGKAAGAAN